MPKNVGRVGKDFAGPPTAILLEPRVPNVLVNGMPIAVVGTPVTPHGRTPHDAAIMGTGSPNVFAGGFPVCGTGDIASCLDPLVSTSNVFVN
jgi:uncharacterized Zn-binding protein involved in type VI secretion